jgi:lysine-specific demethylase/histidyl-hydroxylase NO66
MSTFDLTFENLIHPISRQEFLDGYWGRATLLVQQGKSDHFRDLFSLADFDGCLRTAANVPSNVLHVVASPGSGRPTTLTPVSAVEKEQLYESFLSGDTIRIIGAERFCPAIDLLAGSIQGALDASVGANLFLTPAHSQAFPMHFDTMDGFIVQVAGSKRWRLWEPTYLKPLKSSMSEQHVTPFMEKDPSKLKLLDDLVLNAGDVLYIPRGVYHEAIALDELSLHITYSLRSVSWLDFITRAFELAALEDAELREELPVGFATSHGVQEAMPALFERVMQRFQDKADFHKTLRSMVEKQIGSQVFPPDGHFCALARLDEVGPATLVERRRSLPCLVEDNGTTAAIKFGSRQVQGPRALLPVLQFIRDHKWFRPSDLPESVTLEGRTTLIRRLIREGLLTFGAETGGSPSLHRQDARDEIRSQETDERVSDTSHAWKEPQVEAQPPVQWQ